MTFENLHADTDCNCISGAFIDTTNEYVRRLKKDAVQDSDFLTHSERGIVSPLDDCENICSYKGVSINQLRVEFVEQILTKYKTTFKINPKKGAHYLKFKFKEEAGKVKFAPEEDDQSHYNFFKADNFTLNSLDIIDTIKFA